MAKDPAGGVQRDLAEADRLARAGDARGATAVLKRLLKQHPKLAAAHLRLSSVLNASGDREGALAHLVKASSLAPESQALREEAVISLLMVGKKGQARKLANQTKGPGKARVAAIVQGKARLNAKRLQGARQSVRAGQSGLVIALMKAFPTDPDLLSLASAAALMREDFVAAEGYARQALETEPEHRNSVTNLGLACLRQNKLAAALRVLRPWKDRADASLDLLTNLASALLRLEMWDDALEIAERLRPEAAGDPDVTGVVAQALIETGRSEEALALLGGSVDLADLAAEATERTAGRDAAVALVRSFQDLPDKTVFRLAEKVATWGEIDLAANLVHPLTDQSQDPDPARLYGMASRWSADDPAIAQMTTGLNDEALPLARRGRFGLALAKAWNDVGETEKAFDALDAGNGHLAALVGENPKALNDAVWTAAEAWDAETLGACLVKDADHPRTLFIVGMPRTGSTLFETLFSRHPDVHPLGETPVPYMLASEARAAGPKANLIGLAAALSPVLSPPPPRTVSTDKLLANVEHLATLAAACPNAVFVEVRRNLPATALSILENDLPLSGHPYAVDQIWLADKLIAHERLMAHWETVLGPRLFRPRYEDLVSDPDAVIAPIAAALGLDWRTAELISRADRARITTMSVAQARKPVHQASVARWRKVAHRMQPLLDRLQKAGLWDPDAA